jgi:hypothetical protein
MRKDVVEIQCCRCDRKEYREPPPPDPMTKENEEERMPAFSATIVDETGAVRPLKFDDLCSPCVNTIKGHLAQIAKKIEGVSPMREKKKEKKPAPTPEVKTNGSGAKEKGHAPRA